MAWLQVRVRYNGLQSLQTLVPCQVRRGGILNITGGGTKNIQYYPGICRGAKHFSDSEPFSDIEIFLENVM